MRLLQRYWKVIAWLSALFVIVLCSIPAPQIIAVNHIDKLEHAVAFGGLCGLFFFAYPRKRIWVYLGSFLLGLCVELLQAVIPWRSADVLDLLADGVGVLAAILIIEWLLVPRMKERGLM